MPENSEIKERNTAGECGGGEKALVEVVMKSVEERQKCQKEREREIERES